MVVQVYPDTELEQHVIILGGGTPTNPYQHGRMSYGYNVHILREMDPNWFLKEPESACFASLAKADSKATRERLLQEALKVIKASNDPNKSALTDVALGVAPIHLDREFLNRVSREETGMGSLPEALAGTWLYEEIKQDALTEGRAGVFAVRLEIEYDDLDPRIEELSQQLADLEPHDAEHTLRESSSLDELELNLKRR